MQDFRRVKVWEKSHRFVLQIHALTKAFPQEERYGLTSQIRRSSTSIPTNIAEGCGHRSIAEMVRFCQIAMASASELEYQILLAKDLEYITLENYQVLHRDMEEIKKMLSRFIVSLRVSRDASQYHPPAGLQSNNRLTH